MYDALNRDGSGDDYVHVNIGSTELSANHNIKQIVDIVQKSEKVMNALIIYNLFTLPDFF